MNDQEKAIVRANCREIVYRMEELRCVKSWWESLPEARRSEFKLFYASMLLYLNSAE